MHTNLPSAKRKNIRHIIGCLVMSSNPSARGFFFRNFLDISEHRVSFLAQCLQLQRKAMLESGFDSRSVQDRFVKYEMSMPFLGIKYLFR